MTKSHNFFVQAENNNIKKQYCNIKVLDAFIVQLEYLCYNDAEIHLYIKAEPDHNRDEHIK